MGKRLVSLETAGIGAQHIATCPSPTEDRRASLESSSCGVHHAESCSASQELPQSAVGDVVDETVEGSADQLPCGIQCVKPAGTPDVKDYKDTHHENHNALAQLLPTCSKAGVEKSTGDPSGHVNVILNEASGDHSAAMPSLPGNLLEGDDLQHHASPPIAIIPCEPEPLVETTKSLISMNSMSPWEKYERQGRHYSWQWEHRTGFRDYDMAANVRIEEAFQRGESKVRLKTGKNGTTPMEMAFCILEVSSTIGWMAKEPTPSAMAASSLGNGSMAI